MIKKVYIYTLNCPITDEIKYVGKTIQKPENRLRSHISASKHDRKKDRTHCWIKSLLNKETKPIMKIIEEADSVDREVYWIKYYRELGLKLKNHTDGGDNGTLGATWKVSKEKLVCYKYKNNKPIWQYTLEGKFIKEWESAVEFSRHYKLKDNAAVNSIRSGSTCAVFLLCRKGETVKLRRKILNNPVIVYDRETGIDTEFKNSIEVAKALNMCNSTVSKAIKTGKVLLKRYVPTLKYKKL